MPKRVEQWLRTLIGGIISGGANAVLASLGISAASAIGIQVKALDLNQLMGIFVSGAFVGAMMFLAKSPVPPDSTGDTVMFINPNKSTGLTQMNNGSKDQAETKT